MKKKFSLLILILVTCVLCASLFVACDKGKDNQTYCTVTYVYDNGTQDSTVQVLKGSAATRPGEPEKDGYEFLHWVKQGETEPYDFTSAVNENITLVAIWNAVQTTTTVRLRWSEDESASFVFEGATPRNVEIGTTVSFGLRVSPYYNGTPVVKVNNEEINADQKGNYSFVVEKASSISVSGLTRDYTPIKGLGSAASPYIITKPSQLKTITDAINSGDDKYIEAYFRLDADLDLNGEKLDPIGNDTNLFMGEFDGNGHSVSNFNIDPSTGYVGLFGLVATAVVKNLTVNADIEVECTQNQNYIIGGIVAYSIGGDVINSAFNGSINVISELDPNEYVAYVGGVSGFAQGYSTNYTSTTSYCSVNATISSTGSQEIYSAGGLVSATVGTANSAPAYVNNCVFHGEIGGKIRRAGGIVGYLRNNSSVANCLSTGSIYAQNQISIGTYDTFAAAGGIVGLAENETAVTNSASSAVCTAKCGELENDLVKGDLIGISYGERYNGVDDRFVVLHNSNKVDETSASLTDLCQLLGWNGEEWTERDGVVYPVEPQAGAISYTVTFDFGKEITRPDGNNAPLTQTQDPVSADAYTPIYWVYGGNGLNTFTADDGTISYGYFLDAEHTMRIPSSFLLTSDMTVYVGFEDYSVVAGDYYTVIGETQVHLEFDDNGMMVMYYNAVVARYMYAYDGNVVIIKDGYFAYLTQYKDLLKGYDLTSDYYAEINSSNNTLKIYDTMFFNSSSGFSGAKEIECKKHNDAMGAWYSSDGKQYEFLYDGTGKASTGDTFTYTCSGSSVSIIMGNRTIHATLSADKKTMRTADGTTLSVTKFDEYLGSWESAFNTKTTVTFDGKGSVSYNGNNYTYSIDENGILTFENVTAHFDGNGLLVLNVGGTERTYGREGSFIGSWIEATYNYWINFYGIGKDGYGYGEDSNGITFTYGAASDSELGLGITLYYRTSVYGMGNLQTGQKGEDLLDFAIYTSSASGMLWDYILTYVDQFAGVWNGTNGMELDFNGNGAYDIDSHTTGQDWVVQGEVKVTLDGQSETVRYYYDKTLQTSTFTYKDTEYTVSTDGEDILVNGDRFKKPDGLDAYDYQAEGIMLSFNGKSNVGCGKATLTINNVETLYDYTYEENVVTLTLESETKYTATISEGKFMLSGIDGFETELGLYHAIVGKEYIVSTGLLVGLDGYFSIDGLAKAHIGELAVDAVYIDATYVGLYYDGELLYYVQNIDENTIALVDSEENAAIACVPDGLQGTYTAQDGSVLELDGRSAGAKYIYPIAKLTVTETIDGEEEVNTYIYTYYIENGVMYVSEIDRSGAEDVLVKRYTLHTEHQENFTAFTSETGVTLYLVEIAE